MQVCNGYISPEDLDQMRVSVAGAKQRKNADVQFWYIAPDAPLRAFCTKTAAGGPLPEKVVAVDERNKNVLTDRETRNFILGKLELQSARQRKSDEETVPLKGYYLFKTDVLSDIYFVDSVALDDIAGDSTLTAWMLSHVMQGPQTVNIEKKREKYYFSYTEPKRGFFTCNWVDVDFKDGPDDEDGQSLRIGAHNPDPKSTMESIITLMIVLNKNTLGFKMNLLPSGPMDLSPEKMKKSQFLLISPIRALPMLEARFIKSRDEKIVESLYVYPVSAGYAGLGEDMPLDYYGKDMEEDETMWPRVFVKREFVENDFKGDHKGRIYVQLGKKQQVHPLERGRVKLSESMGKSSKFLATHPDYSDVYVYGDTPEGDAFVRSLEISH